MEIETIASALKQTLVFLRKSESSPYSSLSVDELILEIEEQLDRVKDTKPIDSQKLKFLFAPTGPLQETSIYNAWGTEFLEFTKPFD